MHRQQYTLSESSRHLNLTAVLHLERKKLAKNSNTIILQPNAHIKRIILYFNCFSSTQNLNIKKLTESLSVLAIPPPPWKHT